MKILLIDDHALIRDALRGMIMELTNDATVLEAADCGQGRRLIGNNPDLDLVLLDLSLPDDDGFDMLADLRERYPAVSVVVLSAHEDRDSVVKALDLGAAGFIPKSAQRQVMLSALGLVFSGGIYIPPQILVQTAASPLAPVRRQPNPKAAPVSPADLGLTERQLDVLALMARGKSNKAICRVLDLAEPTVKKHVTAILRVLNVTNRTEAVIAVSELGWELPQPAKS
jgi:DNA-binding NarL/FixJ family response regulator